MRRSQSTNVISVQVECEHGNVKELWFFVVGFLLLALLFIFCGYRVRWLFACLDSSLPTGVVTFACPMPPLSTIVTSTVPLYVIRSLLEFIVMVLV